MPSLQLRYGFVLTQNQERGVTFLNTDTAATLEVEVTNPNAPLLLESISFSFTFGANASCLAASAGDVTAVLPAGWKELGNFGYQAPDGFKIGLDALRFVFAIKKVSAAPGTTQIGVREVSSAGTAMLNPPVSINKLPPTFVLRALHATPTLVDPDGAVTLNWSATPGQSYQIVGPGVQDARVASGSLATYECAAVKTTAPTATFIVSATLQVDGAILTAQANVTVQMNVPQLMSFNTPERPVSEGAIPLQWRTSNTDSVQLIANGVPTTVPLNSPDPAYHAYPAGPVTDFQLRLKRGRTTVDSATRTVLFYRWSTVKQLTVGPGEARVTAFSPDSTRMYVVGTYAIRLYEIASAYVVKTQPLDSSFGGLPMSAAVSSDGGLLFVHWEGTNLLHALSGAALDWKYKWTGVVGFVVDADTPLVYIDNGTQILVCSTATGATLKTIPLAGGRTASSMTLTPDGSALYISAPDQALPLLRYDVNSGAVTTLMASYKGVVCVAADPGRVCLAPTGDRIVEINGQTGAVFRTVQITHPYITRPAERIAGLMRDPAAAGIYAMLHFSGGRMAVLVDLESSHTTSLSNGDTSMRFTLNRYGKRLALSNTTMAYVVSIMANDRWDSVTAAVASDLATQLSYTFVLSQGVQLGLTYLNASQPGTITVYVSSASAVAIESIGFSFLLGDGPDDIAPVTNDITVALPSGWVDQGNFTYAPPSVEPVTYEQVPFIFNVNINAAPGITNIGVREISAAGTAIMNPPYHLEKLPAGFALSNLFARPTEIMSGDTVTLTWAATPQQEYQIAYHGGTDTFTPSSPTAAWTSPPIYTAAENAGFTVSASVQTENGQTLNAQASALVQVDNPEIDRFVQPLDPFITPPVALHWQAEADYCQLFSNGVLIDGNAPANPGTAGYVVTPTSTSTPYTLYAVKGEAVSAPQTVIVRYYSWPLVKTLTFGNGRVVLALTADGATLYAVDSVYYSEIDTASLNVTQRWRLDVDEAVDALAARISSDSMLLGVNLELSEGGNVLIIWQPGSPSDGFGLSAAVASFAFPSQPDTTYFTVSPNRLVSFIDYIAPSLDVTLPDTTAMGGMALAGDNTIYVLISTAASAPAYTLCRFEVDTESANTNGTFGGAHGAAPCISPDGSYAYVPSTDEHSLVAVSLPDMVAGSVTLLVDPAAFITRIAFDPNGFGVYASVDYPAGGATGSALYFINPVDHGRRVLATSPDGPSDLAVNPDGSAIYWSAGQTVMVFDVGPHNPIMEMAALNLAAASMRLTYTFVLSEGIQTGLTYLNAGEPGTITVFLSSTDAVGIESISFNFALGNDPNGSDIADTLNDITIGYPKGWIDQGNFTYTPPSSDPVTYDMLPFTFNVNVNETPGITSIGIREISDSGTAILNPPYHLTKLPAGFVLADLTASPNPIASSDQVTLTWSATAGQKYQITYQGQEVPFTPSSPTASWVSPQIFTADDSVSFSVSAAMQLPNGYTVSAQVSVDVAVDNPEIASFPQPQAPFVTSPVLHWETSNADHCEIFIDGVLIDGNAPANPGSAGYVIAPTKKRTPYTLYAVKGTTMSPSQTVTVLYYLWPLVKSYSLPYGAAVLVLSDDGTTLYAVDARIVTVIDTATDAISGTWQWATGLAGSPLPLSVIMVPSYQGVDVFMAMVAGAAAPQLFIFDLGSLSSGVFTIADNVVSCQCGAGMLYVTRAPNTLTALENVFDPLWSLVLPDTVAVGGLTLSPDFSTSYALVSTASVAPAYTLCKCDNPTQQFTLSGRYGGAHGARPYMTPDGSRLYVPSADEHSIVDVALPGMTDGATYLVDDNGFITSVAIDPNGFGIYACVVYPAGSTSAAALYFIDTKDHGRRVLATAATGPCYMAVTTDGSKIYWSSGTELLVFDVGLHTPIGPDVEEVLFA